MSRSPSAQRALCLLPLLAAACAREDTLAATIGEPPTLHLSQRFEEATVEGELPEIGDFAQIDWRFDRPFEPLPPEESEEEEEGEADEGEGTEPDAEESEESTGDDADTEPEQTEDEDPISDEPGVIVHGVEAVVGIEDLRVEDGRLCGRVSGPSALRFERVAEGDDTIFGIEVRLQVSAGTEIGAFVERPGDFDRRDVRERAPTMDSWPSHAVLSSGPATESHVIELARSSAAEDVRHLVLQPSNEEGAEFAIESVRLITMREHLAGQAAHVDWRGMGEIYRQSLAMHATETVRFDIALPSRPWLDLSLGTTMADPTTFTVDISAGGTEQQLLRRTLTTPDRWENTPIDLTPWADRRVQLTFQFESENEEQVGLFGTLAIRNRDAIPLADGRALTEAPTGVIFVLADTLRRDHLDAYGYERSTAPFLSDIAAEGARFEDNISQGTWTKISVSSMLTSLYPTSNGIKSGSDKLPMSVTTLAENFQQAGYATFATSSVVFSGRSTNLHQGIDVLHERGSVGRLDHSGSKTARTYVDRLVTWIDEHREQPFFAFLHVFDPHSPFEAYDPYFGKWSEDEAVKAHEADIERIQEVEDDIGRGGGDLLPDLEDFQKAEVPHEPFVAREKNWYDESIRGMDAEIARLFERLEELGLRDSTLVVFTSDHGEEFLEHGRHFHGNNAYGEMTNVPLMFWGPRWIGASVVEDTVQSIDIYPTVLELCGLPGVEGLQGQSLVSLIRGGEGFRPRPAFATRFVEDEDDPQPDDIGSYAMVADGYRLIHNVHRPEGHPEFELYDHENDPINLVDLAAEMPERVAAMAEEMGLWRKWVEANRVEGAGEPAELSDDELDQLRALGYTGD